jgi:hypothetical protein
MDIPYSLASFSLIALVSVAAAVETGVTPGPQAAVPQKPRPSAVIDVDPFISLCTGLDNTYACAEAIERHQLAKPELAAVATRIPAGLQLRLLDGRTRALADVAGSDDVDEARFSFRDYLKDIGYFLVHRQRYETRDYVLVHARSGREFPLEDVPVVSPDRRRIVTTLAGLSGMSSGNGVQIWLLEPDGLRLEFELRPDDWEPADAEWEDGRTIRLRRLAPVHSELRAFSTTVRLVLDGRWRYAG